MRLAVKLRTQIEEAMDTLRARWRCTHLDYRTSEDHRTLCDLSDLDGGANFFGTFYRETTLAHLWRALQEALADFRKLSPRGRDRRIFTERLRNEPRQTILQTQRTLHVGWHLASNLEGWAN